MKKITNTLKTTESYLEEVKTKFGDKFDYSLIEYKSAKDYVTIICKEHGEFKQEASYFVNASKGCPNNFSIHFENFSREITMYNKTLVFYGTSNIIRTN